jgi:hypothetical protein
MSGMPRQRSGHILNVSSLGARVAMPGLAADLGAKWVAAWRELSCCADRADVTVAGLDLLGVAAAGPRRGCHHR